MDAVVKFIGFTVFVVFIYFACRKKRHTTPDDISAPMRWIAVGAVLAFLPIVIGVFYEMYGINIYIIEHPFFFTLVVQAIGALLMTVGLFSAYKKFKDKMVDKSGFVIAIFCTSIGCLLNLYYAYEYRLEFNVVNFIIFVFAILTSVIAFAFIKIAKYFTRFRIMGIMLVILAVDMFSVYVEWGADGISAQEALWVYGLASFLFPIVLGVVAIFGCRLSGAKLRTSFTDKTVEAILHKSEKTPQFTALEVDFDILQKLKGYDDVRLTKIVDNPDFHDKPVVEKAREILARRKAWDKIKDLTDADLLEMTMADKGLYESNIVEAASMELYQRGSQLLAAQFAALTPDTLAAIASGAAPAPEGIRLAAQKYLNKNNRLQ